ncbi:hypothetical protein G9A89_016080 [Geosiphon pyriformis]|nr:hypothetical protein G9A89_016080 [Geosiphon pyriformis]
MYLSACVSSAGDTAPLTMNIPFTPPPYSVVIIGTETQISILFTPGVKEIVKVL